MNLSNKQLFEMLNDAFDDEGLKLFCEFYFMEVAKSFGGGSKTSKIMTLLNYCRQHLKMDFLLEKVKEERPAIYEQYVKEASPEPQPSPGTDDLAKKNKLIDILAYLYPDMQKSRRIVDGSGIQPNNISFSSVSSDNWHSIVTEAKKQGKIDALVKFVKKEYPNQEGLEAF